MTTATTPTPSSSGDNTSGRLDHLPSTPIEKPTWQHFHTVVRVKVGEGDAQEVFEVYKCILKFYSGYFRAALDNMENKRFAQDEDNTIALPEEEPSVFRMFKSWLYTQKFGLSPSEKGTSLSLIKLWCFGDRRQMSVVQNQAIDALHSCMVAYHLQPYQHYNFVYENTCEGSPLRKFLVSTHVRRFTRADSALRHAAEWLHEIVVDMGKELVPRPEIMRSGEFARMVTCDFHVHEGVRCNKEEK